MEALAGYPRHSWGSEERAFPRRRKPRSSGGLSGILGVAVGPRGGNPESASLRLRRGKGPEDGKRHQDEDHDHLAFRVWYGTPPSHRRCPSGSHGGRVLEMEVLSILDDHGTFQPANQSTMPLYKDANGRTFYIIV